MKPLDLCRGRHSLHGTGKSSTSVIALDGSRAGAISAQHLCYFSLRNLHRLTRIDYIANIDYSIGINGITNRAEVVVARVGSIGIIAVANYVFRQGVVLAKGVALEHPLARGWVPLIHTLEAQGVKISLLFQKSR